LQGKGRTKAFTLARRQYEVKRGGRKEGPRSCLPGQNIQKKKKERGRGFCHKCPDR